MKKLLIVTGCLAVITLSAIGFTQFNASADEAQLSKEQVREKAESEYPGQVAEVVLEQVDGQDAYAVEIQNEEQTYKLLIDAVAGEIVQLEEIASTEPSDPQTSGQSNSQPNEEDMKDNDEEESDSEASRGESSNGLPISFQQAKEIALAEVGGSLKEIELDEDDGRIYYEIELKTERGEVDIDIDAHTGEIVLLSYDD